MDLDTGYLYHVYNHGNNHQPIFFTDKNYIFFLEKIRQYIEPYADIVAWCLMPNHFHLMVYVKELELPTNNGGQGITFGDDLTTSHGHLVKASSQETNPKTRSLNESIGIMLRSYTRAVNKQEKREGSLFRKKTKAKILNYPTGIKPSFFMLSGISTVYTEPPGMQYAYVCFKYIHFNPVYAGLVKKPSDWAYSSARDYLNIRNGTLINKDKAKEYISDFDFLC